MTRKEEISKAAEKYVKNILTPLPASLMTAFVKGAIYADENPRMYTVARRAVATALKHLWHDAQGDILPDIDKEVIVLCDDGHGGHKVCFGHRPNKKGYLGKSLVTGNVETFYPQTYGKGEWNIPNVKWWLDVDIPLAENK